MRLKRCMTSLYLMTMTFHDDSSKELGKADTGKGGIEIPTPESQTERGDIQPVPPSQPQVPGPNANDTPATPRTDKA